MRLRCCIALLLLFGSAARAAAPGPADAAAGSPDRIAQALVSRMTLREKVAQLQSSAPALPRLGLPATDWWNEGLHGLARNGFATVFPQAIGLAASWDVDLLQAAGQIVAEEARAKFDAVGARGDHARYGGLTFWSPNVNIFRDPRWGRGQETYGEDPFLTGHLAVAFIHGLQGPDPDHPRVVATPKHFVAHSGPEEGRDSFDADISPHDLADTYLPAFRLAVTEGHAGSVMCAYNAVNGTPNCAAGDRLNGLLRKGWGFRGYVVSDCGAVDDIVRFHRFRPDEASAAAVALRAGVDLDCGTTYAALGDAVHRGLVGEADLDRALVRLLAARVRLGEIGQDEPASSISPGDGTDEEAAHRAVALKAAQESIVLLKNRDGTLPLARSDRIAVIGPNADTLETLEANYHGTARSPVTPLAALRTRWGASRVFYAQGSPVAAGVPVTVPETALRTGTGPDAAHGLRGEYFPADFAGASRSVRTDRVVDFDWDRVPPAPGLPADRYAVRWTGVLIPPGTGSYTLAVHVDRCFDCTGHDGVRLVLDGHVVIDDAGAGADPHVTLHLEAAKPHSLVLEMQHRSKDGGVRLQWIAPAEAQLAEALDAEHAADTVIAFLGLSPDVEGEALHVQAPGFNGGDRLALDLPQPQADLLDALLAHRNGRKLVVVLLSGGPVSLGAADDTVPALLQGWYPGEAGGEAIADILSGAADPAGRLPVTIYRSASDLPPFLDYGMQGRTYRYFNGSPLYPFGAGGSYTRFTYANLSTSTIRLQAGQGLGVTATLHNIGARDGEEVSELYVVPPKSPLAPRLLLAGFVRSHVHAGGERALRLTIDPRQFGTVDAAGRRVIEPGRYEIFLGGGQPGTAPGLRTTIEIVGRKMLPP